MKCWTKKKTKFHNIKVWQNKSGGIVELAHDSDALGNTNFYSTYINDKRVKNRVKTFKDKDKALSFVNKYMENNC